MEATYSFETSVEFHYVTEGKILIKPIIFLRKKSGIKLFITIFIATTLVNVSFSNSLKEARKNFEYPVTKKAPGDIILQIPCLLTLSCTDSQPFASCDTLGILSERKQFFSFHNFVFIIVHFSVPFVTDTPLESHVPRRLALDTKL
jgi:hypothetical protein